MLYDYSSQAFEQAYTYEGNDLGAFWTKEKTVFRLWAPTAEAVMIRLYKSGDPHAKDLLEQLPMAADVNGTWIAERAGDLNGVYYTYCVTVDGKTVEAVDPYARAVGLNGQRGMVIDLSSTDPRGWEEDTDPNGHLSITDSVIYELHIRDLTMDAHSGVSNENKGKYLGVIQSGTTNSAGLPTGLDHLKDLGITHLHLLPVFDYGSVDETSSDQFNWGYDPQNFNVPEGVYSSDPRNGAARIREFKEMVLGLHKAGISIVMDVVYNHVYDREKFCFNQIVPGYFSRINSQGVYSNGSFCGNDTATERAMVRKYIVDSVLYWAREYHIDGFRFDLVGLIDTETIGEIVKQVHAKHPNVIFYGEGWHMPTDLTKEGYTLTTQTNAAQVPDFAFFSDTMRDTLKGAVDQDDVKGYVSNAPGFADRIRGCFMACSDWTTAPGQTVNYAACHDNLTLYDKLKLANPEATEAEIIRMNKLAAAIYMTAQGIPLMLAGEELLRSKPKDDGTYDHNSYKSPDAVNSLKWDDLRKYQQVFSYYKGLIAFRKAHPALRMRSAAEIAAHIHPVKGLKGNVTAFHITAGAGGEDKDLFVIFNPEKKNVSVTLPAGKWNVCINRENAGTNVLETVSDYMTVPQIGAAVLIQQ